MTMKIRRSCLLFGQLVQMAAMLLCFTLLTTTEAWVVVRPSSTRTASPAIRRLSSSSSSSSSALHMVDDTDKAAKHVTGEELEMMLTEWEQPLVVDAYATWCGPCLLMAPEFEAAAKELSGKVRFVKLDTDKEETMAARLSIMGLPTLLFLDKYSPAEGEEVQEEAKAVLKGRIEGALRKDNIKDLCEFHFFGGPQPKL